MTTLLLAKHDNHALNDATSKALTAAKALGAPVHVLVAGCQQTLWTENIRFRVAFDINRETTDASYSHICCQSETMSSVPEGGHALRSARVFSHLAPCGRSVARF